MLTKRTNLLFEEELWQLLAAKAAEKELSVGELVRQAVRRVYIEDNQGRILQASRKILANRKFGRKIAYQALINYGRKN